jgi:hypothetical protein
MMPVDQRQDRPKNAHAASLIDEPVPADLFTIRAPAPDWFRWAISSRGQSHFVMGRLEASVARFKNCVKIDD